MGPRGLLFISNMYNMAQTTWKITQELPKVVIMQVGASEHQTKK